MADNDTEQNTSSEAVDSTALTVQSPSKPTQINVDVLKDFLVMAKEEIEVRKQETILKGKEIDNAHTYSMEALKLQAQDLKDGRGFAKSTRRDYLFGAATVFFLIATFLIYCLQTGHEDIAMKIITYGGTSLGSAISGYFYGKNKAENKDSENPPE